jgi:hypothetical protein
MPSHPLHFLHNSRAVDHGAVHHQSLSKSASPQQAYRNSDGSESGLGDFCDCHAHP